VSQYELYLSDQLGNRLALLPDFKSLSWARAVNEVGAFTATFPREEFSRALFGVDRRLEIWRKPEGGTFQLLMVGFLRYLRQYSEGPMRYISIAGPDANDLLRRRIIDADAGSAGSDKSGTADDVMKEYVDENLGGSTVAGRDITAYGFSVQGDLSLGPSVEKSAARRRLLQVLQEIAADAAEQGTPVYFDVVHPTPRTYEFRTYVNLRGIDRRALVLSEAFGTLASPDLAQDWRDEINFVYAAGQGTEDAREVVELEDTARTSVSVFNRCESLFDGRNYSTADRLTSAGRKALWEGRPRRIFTAEVVDREHNRFGKEWNFGDFLTATYEGEQYLVEVAAIQGTVTDRGQEVLRGKLSYVE
jgi:hypothetical protein